MYVVADGAPAPTACSIHVLQLRLRSSECFIPEWNRSRFEFERATVRFGSILYWRYHILSLWTMPYLLCGQPVASFLFVTESLCVLSSKKGLLSWVREQHYQTAGRKVRAGQARQVCDL